MDEEKKRKKIRKQQETPEETLKRLDEEKERKKIKKQQETSEEKLSRLRNDRERRNKMRNEETPEQKEAKGKTTQEVEEQNDINASSSSWTGLGRYPSIDNWPNLVEDDDIRRHCFEEALKMMSGNILNEVVCAVCGELVKNAEVNIITLEELPNGRLLNCENVPENSYTIIDGMVFESKGILQSNSSSSNIQVCKCCLNILKSGKLPPRAIANDLCVGKVPKELEDLTLPEQLLISVHRVKIYIFKLQAAGPATSRQSAMKGNCIAFPQDVVRICKELPPPRSELADLVKVVFVGKTMPSTFQLKKVLKVRRIKILEALQWLKSNNRLYSDIPINMNNVEQLPEDDIPNEIKITSVVADNEGLADSEHDGYIKNPKEENTDNNNDNDKEEESHIIIENTAMVDVEAANILEKDIQKSALNKLLDQEDKILVIPTGSTPVSEYGNPMLWLGSFPTLFPYGIGGAEDTNRRAKISLREWTQHFFSLADSNFRKHPSFAFVTFNVLQRREVCNGATLLKHLPWFPKSAKEVATVTSEDIKNWIRHLESNSKGNSMDERTCGGGIQQLMKQIRVVRGKVHGSDQARIKRRQQIYSLMTYCGLPTVWMTINPADIHSPIVCYFSGDSSFSPLYTHTRAHTHAHTHTHTHTHTPSSHFTPKDVSLTHSLLSLLFFTFFLSSTLFIRRKCQH